MYIAAILDARKSHSITYFGILDKYQTFGCYKITFYHISDLHQDYYYWYIRTITSNHQGISRLH